MKYKKPKGSASSSKIYVIPEFKKEPDIQKLGRAILALVEKLEADKRAKLAESEEKKTDSEGSADA